MNPCESVRRSAALIMRDAKHVHIDVDAVAAYATELATAETKYVDWDADGWHYSADVCATGGKLTCQYIFVLDALNFCFWPTAELEYEQLAVGLRKALEADAGALNADKLAVISADTLNSWFTPNLPNIDERVAKLQELGAVLAAEYDGWALNLVLAAKRSASALVRLITAALPGFRDQSIYRGQQVFFYKRAQILVGDLWAAHGRPRDGDSPLAFSDIDQLTMFADYRVPQILRAVSVLVYSPELAHAIDTLQEIAAGSEEELQIRAATIHAVDLLQAQLVARGRPLLTIEAHNKYMQIY